MKIYTFEYKGKTYIFALINGQIVWCNELGNEEIENMETKPRRKYKKRKIKVEVKENSATVKITGKKREPKPKDPSTQNQDEEESANIHIAYGCVFFFVLFPRLIEDIERRHFLCNSVHYYPSNSRSA